MLIGVPKEIKPQEYRVGLTSASVRELVARDHLVLVETEAGLGVGIDDDMYVEAGATIAQSAQAAFDNAELIIKVKEPQRQERRMLRAGQILFTYLHLAPDAEQTRDLLETGATCVAYETVTSPSGGLPLLAPMSEVAGRMAIQAGARFLEKTHGGLGVLLGGVPGVDPAKVVVLGGGVVGTHAVHVAIGMGAEVWVIDQNVDVLRRLWRQFGRPLNTVYSTRESIERHCHTADLVIGGVLIPGAAAPKLLTHDVVQRMKPGAVIVDVAIDQGGCCETSRVTTHDDPAYKVAGVIHYCVANMPAAVSRTSAFALNNVTLPYVIAMANCGVRDALCADRHLLRGLNIHRGRLTNDQVSRSLGIPFTEPIDALAA